MAQDRASAALATVGMAEKVARMESEAAESPEIRKLEENR